MAIAVENESLPHRALTRQQRTITLIGALLSMFMSSLNQTVIGTAMPRIIIELGGFAHYTWVATGFMITSTITVPIVGKLSDMYGRKRFYLIGQGIFIIGSLLSGLSQTMTQLILFRGFQGIGAGTMMANTVAITADLFPPAERGKYSGMMTGVMGLSSIIGPTLGGFITDALSWHWVFWVNIPLGVSVVILVYFYFPDLRSENLKPHVDFPGLTTFILALVPAMLALSWGGVEQPWISLPILGLLAFSLIMAILFLVIETRSKEPLIPLSLYKNQIFKISQIIIFLMGMGMFGSMIFIPLFFQGVLGTSATISGSFMTPMMLGLVVGSFTSGQFLSRAGGHYRIQGMIGLGAMVAGMGLLSRMTPQTAFSGAVMNIILTGIGIGIIMPCYTIAVQNSVPYHFLGIATSLMVFARSIGGTLGLAVFGAVMNNRFRFHFLHHLPPAVNDLISPDKVAALAKNPQVLISPRAQMKMKAFFSGFGNQGVVWYDQTLQTLRQSLSFAISQVFTIALGLILIGFLANFFIKEIPLRKQHDFAGHSNQVDRLKAEG
jgi:EmrB/QacA subfamily drug resistance transporter